MNSEFRVRLGPLAPAQIERPLPLYSGDRAAVVLRRLGALDRPVSVVNRLRSAGVSLRVAHEVTSNLADATPASCEISAVVSIDALALDLRALNIEVSLIGQASPAPAPVGASAALVPGSGRRNRHDHRLRLDQP